MTKKLISGSLFIELWYEFSRIKLMLEIKRLKKIDPKFNELEYVLSTQSYKKIVQDIF